ASVINPPSLATHTREGCHRELRWHPSSLKRSGEDWLSAERLPGVLQTLASVFCGGGCELAFVSPKSRHHENAPTQKHSLHARVCEPISVAEAATSKVISR